MRITAGELKGRILSSPAGFHTRPTSDRARQAIFNILNHAGWRTGNIVDGAHAMDVFAGTGALGLEAISQGATDCVFIENNALALKACQKNIDTFNVAPRCFVQKTNATHLTARPAALAPRTLVFLDPPYGRGLGAVALLALLQKNWLADNAVISLEMSKKEPEEIPPQFSEMDRRSYGIAEVVFLMRKSGV